MISEYSKIIKSNPYVAPVDIGLMTKVLSLKDQQFKQNAAQIQSELDQAGSLDLAKQEDKEYLNGKLNSLTQSINQLGGVDLGDASVANQLHGMTSSMYGDDDLLTAISSTQSIRKLQSQYDQMMNDPKLSKGYAPQNYQHDMQFVNAYTSNGKRTVAGEGYTGPTNPTPFFNIDAYAVEAAKRVKVNYTKSTTKEGIYLINGTTKEVTADQIKAEIQASLYENPQAMKQASINSAYLKPNITGQDLYTERVDQLTKNRDAYKKVYDDYLISYATLPANEQIQRAEEKKVLEANYLSYDKELTNTKNLGVKPFNENIDGYRTNDYINKMTNHLANSFSFTEKTNEVKPDLAAAAFMKNQLDAASKGLMMVPNPSSPSGYDIVADPNAVVTAGSKSSTGKAGAGSMDPIVAGAEIPNVQTGASPEAITDETATKTILELNQTKQATLQKIIADAIQINPELSGALSSTQAQVGLVDIAKGYNDPNLFEIEDIQAARNNPALSKNQVKCLDELWKAYQTIQAGGTPERTLSESQLNSLKQLSILNTKTELYEQARTKSMGYGNEPLTPDEKLAINMANSDSKVKEKLKPKLIASRWPDGRLNYKPIKDSFGAVVPVGGMVRDLGQRVLSDLQSWGYGIESALTQGKEGTSLSVYEKDGKYIPADGKAHTYKTNYTVVTNGSKVISKAPNKSITIPKEGIDKQTLIDYVQPYDKSVTTAKGDLTEVLLLETPEQISYAKGTNKLKERKLIVKDPNAYKALNDLNMANNLAYTPDMPIQNSPSFLKAKALMIETAKTGDQSNVLSITSSLADILKSVNSSGKYIPSAEEVNSAYISRIGNSTSDPLQMEVEMVINKKTTVGKKEVSTPIIIKKQFTREELNQTLGIQLPSEEEYLDKVAIDMNGRTKPKVFSPTISNPDLIVPMEIVKDPNNPQRYFPQIMLPDGVRLPLDRLASTLPSLVAQNFQKNLDDINKYKKVEIGGKIYTINNTQEFYNAYILDSKQPRK